ncbi:hypothetical protein N4R57_20950 [Rhodobacteraceae bacterium D3-12]|nr:hypothetical protein N4R57_20950 [Rhodobacteraceae bacterium D3-12]
MDDGERQRSAMPQRLRMVAMGVMTGLYVANAVAIAMIAAYWRSTSFCCSKFTRTARSRISGEYLFPHLFFSTIQHPYSWASGKSSAVHWC